MKRVAFAIGLIALAQSVPAMAMPNAFWIFGFHVPGKQGPKSDVVMTGKSTDALVSRTPTPMSKTPAEEGGTSPGIVAAASDDRG